ncbi:MAG: hypothetical protein Q9216_000223 [Gyalolechia sp. 2 TL-2023]
MKLASRWACSILTVLSTLHVAAAQDNSGLKPTTYKGCFSSSDGFEDQGSYTYQSPGYCQKQCADLDKPVMALMGGSNCWCGDLLPVAKSKISDAQCSTDCQGYPDDKCGGDSAWSVSLTGLNNNVGSIQDSNSDPGPSSKPNPNPPATVISSIKPASTTSIASNPATKSKPSSPAAAVMEPDSTKNKPPSTITRASTVVVTAPGQTQAAPVAVETHDTPKGPNTAGIAAGVVVGVVAICAVAGGLFFFLRNRKRRAMADAYQSNGANPFETESKPPPSSCSMSDSRLEPSVMMQRRQSDGSIADNQDYSRRILKVTNPDGT